MTVYGYARVSTKKQGSKYGIDRQKKVLKDNGLDLSKLTVDEISGTKRSRKGLDHLLGTVRAGDTVKCVSMDRLGRSVIDCLELIEKFRAKGVGIEFIKEGIDTNRNDAMTNAFIAIASAFAQMERERMLERQEETFEAMRERGLQIGRPRVDQEKLDASVEMYLAGGKSYREISRITGISAAKICLEVKAREAA